MLILVSRHCKIYAGDTCQTISKVNRFRFSELNNIFFNFKKILPNFDTVESANLNLNYRLNSKILHLSTYMAYFIRECFPNTLDKFQDDFSIKIIKQKPIILNNINSIINNITNNQLKNDEKTNKNKDNEENKDNKKNDYTLAANHCFIYNNELDGKELDKLYGENIYKLNVHQSKV